MVLCSLSSQLRGFQRVAVEPRGGIGLQMPPRWGGGCIGGQNTSRPEVRGPVPTLSNQRGPSPQGLLGAAPPGAQVWGSAAAHMNMLGRGQS